MRQHGHERIFHRANHASGHVRFAQTKSRMNGSDYEIELRQNFIRKIKRTVAKNVAFDSSKETEGVQLFVQLSNRGDLRDQFFLIEPVRLNLASAVIGNAEILQAERLRGFRHFFKGVVSVARSSVTMKRAPQVFLLNQFWERMFLGGFELAPIFP